jgi:hypothetical protein
MRALILALLMASPLAAQTAPETSLVPQVRPDPEDRVPADEPPADATGAMQDDMPDGMGIRDMLREADEDYATCLADLDGLGTAYTEIDGVVDEDPDCGILRPLEIAEIVPGIAMRPDAVLRCDTARALARWTADFAVPAARRLDRGPITALDHGSTYICRRRNNQPDGALSEHAFGNAVDVMGVRFADGDALRIEPRADSGSIEEAFQRTLRGAACLYFTTVLGPGADAYHDDHLHMDVKRRDSGYRLCQ